MKDEQIDRLIWAVQTIGEGLKEVATELRRYNENVYERETDNTFQVSEALGKVAEADLEISRELRFVGECVKSLRK